MHDLLFGEQVQIFSYREIDRKEGSAQEDTATENRTEISEERSEQQQQQQQENLVVNEECSDFLQIFLDVKYKNLYSAWAASSQQDVDYTTPTGSKAGLKAAKVREK